MKGTRAGWLALLMLVASAGSMTALAVDDLYPICPLSLHMARAGREELRLELQLAETDRRTREEVFALVEELWQNEAVERLRYYRFKQDRDLARLSVEHHEHLLRRQVAILEQYRSTCDKKAREEEPERTERAINEAYFRYWKADCDSRSTQVGMDRVRLEFQQEFLSSVRELRKNEYASRVEVILAERKVDLARQRLDYDTRRLEICRKEVSALEKGEKD
jgi:hypothetical protein